MFTFGKGIVTDPLEIAKAKIKKVVAEHVETLARKRIQLLSVDSYGVIDATRWNEECQYFVKKVVLPHLTDAEMQAVVKAGLSNIAIELMERPTQLECKRLEHAQSKSSSFCNTLSPLEYERYCANQLRGVGWECTLTKGSGDQGVDVLAKKRGQMLVVQCKKYTGSVGNAAVQEAIAAQRFMRADFAAVVTNASYTKAANELATATGVLLLHHTDLTRIDKLLLGRTSMAVPSTRRR